MVWNQLPVENGQPADLVLGQSDLNLRDENGGGTPTASSMRWPHAIAIWQDNLIVKARIFLMERLLAIVFVDLMEFKFVAIPRS
ncbi:MAG: hypothetical protein MUD14_28275 [Hydrococcus sp. Prado102]|nr:hypothetical protein [Hydrococcus sp. Prado102]